jgi:hypothetical protein
MTPEEIGTIVGIGIIGFVLFLAYYLGEEDKK